MSKKPVTAEQAEVKATRKLAMAGDPAANVQMGDWHTDGNTLDYSPKRALRYYRKAAEAGSADGQCKTAGLIWEASKSGPELLDAITEATKYTKQAAIQGNAIGRQMLVTFWGVLNDTLERNLMADFQRHAEGMDPVGCSALANDILTFLHDLSQKPAAEAAPTAKA